VKREKLMQLHVEREPIGSTGRPSFNHSRIGHGIEGGVDLYQFEMFRVPTEPVHRAHFFWIPPLDKARVRPTGRADENSVLRPLRHKRTTPSIRKIASHAGKIGCGGGI
jgi:hypothetical protein